MNVPAFIARRIAFNRKKTFSRFIIRLAVAATAISVTAMLLTLGFTKGFQYTVGHKVFSIWGHVRVQYAAGRSTIAEEQPTTGNDTVLHTLRADKDVITVNRYASRNAVLRSTEGIEIVQLKGVDKQYDFSNMQSFLRSGRWIRFPDSNYSNEITLSSYTANQLKLKLGDKILVYFLQPGNTPRVRPLNVTGIFKIGIEDYDKLIAICDLRLIQRLNGWDPDQIGGYEVFIRDADQADSINNRIFDQLPTGWGSRTTQEIFPNIFDWLNLQDFTIGIVLVIMTVIAILNLVTCLIILVLERTRMVGILKAVGARNSSIQWIFLIQGAYITLAGLAIGNIAAFLIIWLQTKYGFITLPEDSYFISKAVVKLEWWQIVTVNAVTFVICLAILMIPTIIIRRVQPSRAMQFR